MGEIRAEAQMQPLLPPHWQTLAAGPLDSKRATAGRLEQPEGEADSPIVKPVNQGHRSSRLKDPLAPWLLLQEFPSSHFHLPSRILTEGAPV